MKTTKNKQPQPPPPKQKVEEIDYSQFETTGFERTTTEDLGIPFLMIVQKGSPEFDKTNKDYATKKIEGIDVGDVFNTVTRQIVHVHGSGKPLIFVPCNYQRLYVEWKPRNSGGGFVRNHDTSAVLDECQRNDKNQDVLPNGNIIVTTGYFFGYSEIDGVRDKCLIAMSSTQLKKARQWLSIMMNLKRDMPDGSKAVMPMFSHRYAISTVPEQNAQGSWFGWTIEGAGVVRELPLLKEFADTARKFNNPTRPQIAAPQDSAEDSVM